MSRRPDRLFHFTCEHGAKDIRKSGIIQPGSYTTAEGSPLAWFTDLEPPAPRHALGLTMRQISCDRTRFAFEIQPDWDIIEWWMRYRRDHREFLPLEDEPGAMPMHWFIAEAPHPVYREIHLRQETSNVR